MTSTLKEKDSYQVLGVDISPYSIQEFYLLVEERLKDNRSTSPPLFVVTVNPEIAIHSIIDNDFKEVLKTSSINTADGVGISWAISYLYNEHIERITGSDSMELICTHAAKYSQSVYFFGAAPGIALQASAMLKKRINHLIVEGTYSPDKPDLKFEQLPIRVQYDLQKASVIFVALGAPSQEKWIHENLKNLPHCKLIIGIGGGLDFIAGRVKRAPVILQKSGLEWIYRLFLNPSRWRRMIKLPLFALNVMLLKPHMKSLEKPSLPEARGQL